MADDDRPRTKKLTFKGDKPKKRKRKAADVEAHADDTAGGDEAWVLPDDAAHIRGPSFIVHPSEPALCLTYDATRARAALVPLAGEPNALAHVPGSVAQVWVVTRVAGAATVNVRTGAPGGGGAPTFLSCDAHGLVSADREARGPQEEWTPMLLPDAGGMVAFMNVYEKYLAVDETAGGVLALRGDSDTVGFAERFWVKVQAKYKREAREELKKKDAVALPTTDEAESNKIFQTWGAGKSIVSADDNRELKRARKEGRVAEALLDRRSKLKSDRFC